MTTVKEMIADWNGRHPDRALKPEWKSSKDALHARIEEMERELAEIEVERKAADPDEPKEVSKPIQQGTIGGMVEHLLITSGASYAEIVRLVRAAFPEARTTAKSVASVAFALRKKGVPVKTRRAKA